MLSGTGDAQGLGWHDPAEGSARNGIVYEKDSQKQFSGQIKMDYL